MEQLDQQALALTKAIRQHESGGDFNIKGKSGESGAYQFTEPTWKGYAKEILGDENAPMTPQNQNKVAYTKVKQWKDSGKNVGQIASMWNAGEGRPNAYKENYTGTNKYGVQYDTPAYAKAVAEYYQQYKQGDGQSSQTQKSSGTTQTNTGARKTFSEQIGGITPDPIQQQRKDMKDAGEAVSVNPTKTEPTLGGQMIRGVIKPFAQVAASGKNLVQAVQGKPQTDIKSGYLGNVERVGKGFDVTKGLTKENVKSVGNAVGTGVKIAGTMQAGGATKNIIKGVLGNVAKKGSALANPEITQILTNSAGKGTAANMTRQQAINALGNALKETKVSQIGGKTEQLILKALKELNPTAAEKASLLKKFSKGAASEATRYILYNALGDKLGGMVNKVLP